MSRLKINIGNTIFVNNIDQIIRSEHGDYRFSFQEETSKLIVAKKSYVFDDPLGYTARIKYKNVGSMIIKDRSLDDVIKYVNKNFGTNFMSENIVDIQVNNRRYKLNIEKAVEIGLLIRADVPKVATGDLEESVY